MSVLIKLLHREMYKMAEQDSKVIRVTDSTYNTLKEMSERTSIKMSTILELIFCEVQKQLDLMQSNKKLLFMSDLYIDKQTASLPKTIIRLSDACSFGLNDLTKEQRDEILKAFDYSTDGKFTDLREKKEVEKK